MSEGKNFQEELQKSLKELQKVKGIDINSLLSNDGLFNLVVLTLYLTSPWMIEEMESYRQTAFEKKYPKIQYMDAQIDRLKTIFNPEKRKQFPGQMALLIFMKLIEKIKKAPEGAPVEDVIVDLDEILPIVIANSSDLIDITRNPSKVN